MCEEDSYQIIYTSAVNQAVFCYYWKFAKIIIEKENMSVGGSKLGRNEMK